MLYVIIAGTIIIAVILFFIICWRSPHADEAIQVTGLKPRTLIGKGSFIIPGIEKTCIISLESIPLTVEIKESTSQGGLLVDVYGTAMVKVASNPKAVATAVEQFCQGSQKDTKNKIAESVTRVLIGQLRSIVATMTIDDIIADMEKFSANVKQGTADDMAKMGLELISYTLAKVATPSSKYLENKAAQQTAASKAEADIATAEKQRDTDIQTSQADRDGKKAKLLADTEIAASVKYKHLSLEQYRGEQAEATKKADAAGVLEDIRQKEIIAKQEEQLAIQQAQTKEKELIASVIKPAEAEKERVIIEAQAIAEQKKVEAEAEAAAIKMKGDAEAAVILAKGEAEAKAMKIKAEAYKQYGSAAMIDIVAEKLPQVAESVAKPLSAIDNVTVVGGGENISKMSNAVLDGATNVMSIIKSSTGIDIPDLLKKKLEADAKANEPFLD
jgi:flotillin